MRTACILLALIGIAFEIVFIWSELKEKMLQATILKAIASACFVALGAVCYGDNPGSFGLAVLIGLILGMAGDVLLNLRNQFKGGMVMKVFALGVVAFLAGHIAYISALAAKCNITALLIALAMTVIISFTAIPPLMKRITAPSKGLKIFGYVYLVIVIAMFSCSAGLLITTGLSALNLVFFAGALLFLFSDFVMIYYTFGKKLPPLRVTNLMCYYIGQLLIAACIALA